MTQKFRHHLRFLFLVFFHAGVFSAQVNAQYGLTSDSLTINNVSGYFNSIGRNFENGTAKGFRAPKNSNLGTMFMSALWVGGYENNLLKISANTYRQSGSDFFPGPLDTVTAQTSTIELKKWDHVWHISRTEINDFLKSGTITASITNWPGNGTAGTRESNIQAPFIDVDHDGIYNPLKGDYPDMKGDEMLWWVNNDTAGYHSNTRGRALGVEISTSAYAFSSANEAINNTIFVEYKITNRSGNTINQFFAGIWTDFDIGYPFDDYVGSMPGENVYFGYNGKPSDLWYGSNPPVQSVLFLHDSISRFLSYNNDANSVNGNPGFPNPYPKDYYNYLGGIWKNDSCMKYGSDGLKGSKCVNYAFDGDVSDSLKGWTEHNAGIQPGDRKCVGTVGPYTIKPGGVLDISTAYIFSQKLNGNTDSNFIYAKQNWNTVRNFYHSNITGISSPGARERLFSIFPNPATTQAKIAFANGSVEKIVIIDNMGRVCLTVPVQKEQQSSLIDLSRLPGGIYTVIAVSNLGQYVQKLIIAR